MDTDPNSILQEAPSDDVISPLSREEIEKLVTDNMKLAWFFADQWKNIPGVTDDDVKSQAMHGLVKAANTYAPSKGKFSSWAAPIIRNFLGHLNFHQGVQRDHEVVSLDAPIGGDGEGSDDATMADRIGGSVDPEIGRGMSQSTAAQIVDDELANIPEPKRSMVRRWMAGESYRDLQADYGMSFTMIMHHVKGELSKIKQSLAAKGILSMSDIWPESLETDSNGKFIYECLLTHVTVGLALQQLQEKDLRTKLSA